ncbi:isocitrate dehydrogenase [NAD] subunit gamma, mitochondrial-like [Rhopilema esculentum]|uniref:isocitrate dehydrogenase [NAD] subunit gamma, mitochondrial-like n=1 Tax=Rhopilema esculentum TaxID=499914 RepID=UPI0031DAB0DB|eukprot:gene12020-2605_t
MIQLFRRIISRNNLCKFHGKLQVANFNSRSPTGTYGGRHTVTMLPADGIGPRLMQGTQEVFRSAGVPIDFEVVTFSPLNSEESSETIEDAVTSVQRNGVALKGNWMSIMDGPHDMSSNVQLRHNLDLFANVVRCKSFPSVETRHKDVDVCIVRENTEGEYSHLEHENVSGVIEMMKIVTEERSERIADFAFRYAKENGRKKVTAIHKANIMKMSDGLFLNTCRKISHLYPDIEFSDMIIDNCAMQLVSNPKQFDVMVMPNLYGNVITNIAAALVGGPGIPPGANYSNDFAVFESGTRNSGKAIADKNIANPMSFLFAGTNMLRHLGLSSYAQVIDKAIENIVVSRRARTPDIGGQTTTSEFFEILEKEIEAMRSKRRMYPAQ